ncbi:CAAX protease [Leptothermofonsia sichuanensis E412]|uniref:CAAX protease n=1 Tax=Leptothermofonsia sichuanensis TaxID=2917832 RepID=UPI001CA6D6BB|nr:CAAX protease [Leptothermofonsia sichuanensis]QZZ18872.1 CAAX protease [Leptothermofonsia sichuanensis E412]
MPHRRIVKFVGITILACLCVLTLAQVRGLFWNRSFVSLDATWELTFELVWFGFVGVTFAALLAPLEALGWWAGWYGDEINTALNPGTLAEPFPLDGEVSRYVIYLDGISQAQHKYLPEVEQFLEELAIALPDDIVLIKGIMPYSVMNRPLTQNRLMSWFWQLADRFQMTESGGILGLLIGATINIRNILAVSVSADQRYGPIYNQGIAQVIYNSLINHGYQPESRTPITLLGYSGGAQVAVGSAPYVKRALNAPIEVIALSGVVSGNHNILLLEHLYYISGEKDLVEKEGPILFPKRWKLFPLSYWNRAKRRGKISFISLGAVGHNGAQGPYGAEAYLPDGRTHLQQTVEMIAGIIQGISPLTQRIHWAEAGNYDRYIQAAFNQPGHYPLDQGVDPDLYRAIAPWMGRLILPEQTQRQYVRGVLFEVHHAPPDHRHLVGHIVPLCWRKSASVQHYLNAVKKDVHFSQEAIYSQQQGCVHPFRLNHWQQVDPLESLAGAHPVDDVIVMLEDPVVEEIGNGRTGEQMRTGADGKTIWAAGQPACVLTIATEPIQITGRYYALVKILGPVCDRSSVPHSALPSSPSHSPAPFSQTPDHFHVVHFNPASRQFDGVEEIVRIPQVIVDVNGIFPASNQGIEKSPPNEWGWYIYGAKDATGAFVVQSLAPRALLRLQPDEFVVGRSATWNYLKRQMWKVKGQKGKIRSVLLSPVETDLQPVLAQWQEGTRTLLMHLYGGIGGKKREPPAKSPLFFGHFAYGVAEVVREPLADELMFNITYYQVYTHNVDGIVAGKVAWNRFLGDRQFGWMGSRPTADILIKLGAFTDDFDINGVHRSVLDGLLEQLEEMVARYRIGDGTGGTYVGPANNCVQDSNQALYMALKRLFDSFKTNPQLQTWMQDDPGEAERYAQLVQLSRDIRRKLLPLGTARADWVENKHMLGISPEEHFFEGLLRGLISWRTLIPRLASEVIARQFLKQNALVWILRTNQVGGYDPDIEPLAPTQIGW